MSEVGDPGQVAQRCDEAIHLGDPGVGLLPERQPAVPRGQPPEGRGRAGRQVRPWGSAVDLLDDGGDPLGDRPGWVEADIVGADQQDHYLRLVLTQFAMLRVRQSRCSI